MATTSFVYSARKNDDAITMASPLKILLIQLYSNGDCLYATTIAKQAKVDYPGCKVQWLVFPSVAAILKNNPFIDELFTLEKIINETGDDTYKRAIAFAKNAINVGTSNVYYFTQLLADTFSNYDGCLRRSMYRNYPNKITVDKRTALHLDDTEVNKANDFASKNNLSQYKNIILFEASPMSGQVLLTDDDIVNIASSLANISETCVVTSSFKSFNINHPNVFDGSVLSIRETVAFSHHCTLVLGCSSGLSWGTLSTAGKVLPMVQLLNSDTYIFNPPSIDFIESGHDINQVIELYYFTPKNVVEVFEIIYKNGFAKARQLRNQHIKNKFILHRGIVHEFIKKGKLTLLAHFIKINIKQNGYNKNMLAKIAAGFVLFPAQYLINLRKK